MQASRKATLWLVLLVSGCATGGEFPAVDLNRPGWSVWTGQAIWTPAGEDAGVAGELIAARHSDGSTLVVMSKPPIPIFNARRSEGRWQIAFAGRERAYGGRGRPPDRFVWFWLPGMLSGEAPPPGWTATRADVGRWEISNGRGERIQLVLDP